MIILLFALCGLLIGILLNLSINKLVSKETTPRRLPIILVVTGALFALLYWKFGLSLQLGISLIYACVLIVIFAIDMENRLILNKITYPAMIITFAFSFIWPGFGWVKSLQGAGVGLLATGMTFLIYPSGIGIGDIKLGILIGLMIGFPLILWVLILSVIGGGFVGTGLLLLKLKKKSDFLPLGPFLATSTLIFLLW